MGQVPDSVDVVIFDIDNVLDDYAKFAFSVSTDVIVPTSLNPNDFERLCSDPRNGSLFDFMEGLPARLRPNYRAVIFNRVKCIKNEGEHGDAFGISSDDKSCRDTIQAKFASKLGLNSIETCVMRELPGSLLQSMMSEQKRPLVALNIKNNSALPNAQDNLKKIVESIMR